MVFPSPLMPYGTVEFGLPKNSNPPEFDHRNALTPATLSVYPVTYCPFPLTPTACDRY
jgi:hypothetical protein